MATLTDDAVGKAVVDAEGKELGIVSKVENGAASVEPNPSLLEHAMAKLGWERESEDEYTVTEDMIDSVGEEIRLRGTI